MMTPGGCGGGLGAGGMTMMMNATVEDRQFVCVVCDAAGFAIALEPCVIDAFLASCTASASFVSMV
jgi:hypothetical protein